ncbi:hypothetical protein QWY28_22780, partial [Nocardioides sp. SOB77]
RDQFGRGGPGLRILSVGRGVEKTSVDLIQAVCCRAVLLDQSPHARTWHLLPDALHDVGHLGARAPTDGEHIGVGG